MREDASGAERGASHHVFVSRSSGVQVASEYRFESIVKKLSDTFRTESINFRFTSFRQFTLAWEKKLLHQVNGFAGCFLLQLLSK